MSTFISQGYWGQKTFTIPPSFDTIGKDALKGCLRLKRLVVPGTVKKIQNGAFCNCVNLREVVLEEGIEELGYDLFAGCEKLHRIAAPNSVKYTSPYTFQKIPNLKKPVLNASGTTYIYYPQNLGEKRVTIPRGVQTIQKNAFSNYEKLEEVILPDTLERIEFGSFKNTGLKSLVLPKGLKHVAHYSFCLCYHLMRVDIRCDFSVIQPRAFEGCHRLNLSQYPPSQSIEYMRIMGKNLYLVPQKQELPADGHESDLRFLQCAAGCLMGRQEAMEQMADYFHERQESGHPFYLRAERFWRLRLYYLGNAKAKQWLYDWIATHPNEQMETAAPAPIPNGDGRVLRALGFLFFDPNRDYDVKKPDDSGGVEAFDCVDEDGPDEDGFGMEIYYDWWYMTENLAMVPGAGYIHSYSNLDKRNNEQKFKVLHDLVAETWKNHPELIEEGIRAEVEKCLK